MIGGAAGAAPPVLGWTAVTGDVSGYALLLFLIIFTWTPPHFWALAIARKADYEKAEIPMLPVTHGEDAHQVVRRLLHDFAHDRTAAALSDRHERRRCTCSGPLLFGGGFLYYA